MQDGSVPVKTFLERLLPEAMAAISDPAASDKLEARDMLIYTLQVLHSAPLGGELMEEDAFGATCAAEEMDGTADEEIRF